MKLAILSAAALAIALPALAQSTSTPSAPPSQDEVVKSFQETNAELLNGIVGTRAMLKSAQAKIDSLNSQISDLMKQVADLNKQNVDARSKLALYQSQPSGRTPPADTPPAPASDAPAASSAKP